MRLSELIEDFNQMPIPPAVGPFYHGSTTNIDIGDRIMPPEETLNLSERGRKKNLDKVFFTKDLGLAKIYAGRARNSVGGTPIVYQVTPMGDIGIIDTRPGASVYYSDWAFVKGIVS